MDWASVLNLELAQKNVRTDIFGDWHRDPWDWPENDWLLSDKGRTHLVQALNEDGTRRVVSLDVPKENFSTRPAVVFDPLDRLIYQALVDRVSVKLIAELPRWCYSWRLSRRSPTAGKYVDMGREWEGYRSHLTMLSGIYDCALTSDIVSFFPSIPVKQLIDSVYDICGESKVVDRLCGMLAGWNRVIGRAGLPMRANASCVLASMYLRPVDDVLLMHGKTFATGSGILKASYALGAGTACRWVDDVWLFGGGRADLRAAQMDLEDAMRSLGLNMNLAKTDALEGDEMVAKARQLEHSAVDVALMREEPDFEPLDALLDRLLEKPEIASHTSVRFATVRMRKYKRFERVGDFITVAERMPHASLSLARLFHDSGHYRELGGWFAEYTRSKWARMEVSVAQLGTMFPSAEAPDRAVLDALVEKVTAGCSISLLSLVMQRLAAWDPDEVRGLIRELAKKADNPHIRRVLALAALNANETRSWVSRLLSEFRENAITHDLLRERNFLSVPAGADFVRY